MREPTAGAPEFMDTSSQRLAAASHERSCEARRGGAAPDTQTSGRLATRAVDLARYHLRFGLPVRALRDGLDRQFLQRREPDAAQRARDAVQAIQVITDPSRVEGASDALGELGGEGACHG